jgi:hypothetical protein
VAGAGLGPPSGRSQDVEASELDDGFGHLSGVDDVGELDLFLSAQDKVKPGHEQPSANLPLSHDLENRL